jgi:predicted nucleic acid-binding protein
MIVVDSSVWIAHLRNLDSPSLRKFRAIQNSDDILVGDLVLLEVLQGARDERHAARIERAMRQFRLVSMLDAKLAVRAARNYRNLRSKGITIRKTVDVIIATFCIENQYMLLHSDRDFDPFAAQIGLVVA